LDAGLDALLEGGAVHQQQRLGNAALDLVRFRGGIEVELAFEDGFKSPETGGQATQPLRPGV